MPAHDHPKALWLPCIQLSAIADDDEHRAQLVASLQSSDGCIKVRDLHNPRFGRNQLVCAYFHDEPSIADADMPDGMRRVLCPSHLLA